jgi:hypothetical protein
MAKAKDVNGEEAEIRRIIAEIDGEVEGELAAHRRALEARLTALDEKVAELVESTRPKLVRSTMTALDKTRYIRRYGLPAYEKIPWA